MKVIRKITAILTFLTLGCFGLLFFGVTNNGLSLLSPDAYGQGPPRDNVHDGTLYPQGYTPVEIKNGMYPREYLPNTEKLGANEMRVIALGTGMPNAVTKNQKASSWLVELGNGEKFVFDSGNGSKENLDALRPDWSKIDKVFLSHLHIDHAGDLIDINIDSF